jgi:hypothetical protein
MSGVEVLAVLSCVGAIVSAFHVGYQWTPDCILPSKLVIGRFGAVGAHQREEEDQESSTQRTNGEPGRLARSRPPCRARGV